MTRRRKHRLTARKARKILRHGSVRGRSLTKRQKRFFGLIAGGRKSRRYYTYETAIFENDAYDW